MWKSLIEDLSETGMTQVEIAEACDCSQSYISDLVRGIGGKRVSYDIGKKLVALHDERCKVRRKA